MTPPDQRHLLHVALRDWLEASLDRQTEHLREGSLLRALHATDVRAPGLLAADPDLKAHLFEFADGEDCFGAIDDPQGAMGAPAERLFPSLA